ncbi:hypothetical protein E4U49_006279 [Claviceps purpurea]|nr:hypothetical protein E4U49_006279 [Claviceps purpurea]
MAPLRFANQWACLTPQVEALKCWLLSSEVAHKADCSANLALNLAPHDIACELNCQSTKEYVTDAGSVLAPFGPPLTVRLRIVICHKPELHLAVSLLRHSAWASPRDTRLASQMAAGSQAGY